MPVEGDRVHPRQEGQVAGTAGASAGSRRDRPATGPDNRRPQVGTLSLPPLAPGDILAFRGRSLISRFIRTVDDAWANHMALVVKRLADDDYAIAEALGRGITFRRLSAYRGKAFLQAFRPRPQPATHWEDVFEYALSRGDAPYDWPLLLAIGLRRLFRIPLPYSRNHAYICSEFVADYWHQYGIRVSSGSPPTPRTIEMAAAIGWLTNVTGGAVLL